MNLTVIRNKLLNSKEIKNAGWLIGGRVAQMLLSLLVGIWTARYLGPENQGIISYAAAYVAFFTALSSLGINNIIIKEFIDHPDEQGTAIGTTFFLRLISGILSELMILAIVGFANRKEPIIIAATMLYSMSIFFQVADTLNYWFQARYQSKVVSLATLLAYVVTSAYRVVLILLNKDVRWFAFAASVDTICIAAIMLAAYHKNNGPKLKLSQTKAKELLKKSYNFILVYMMVSVYEQTDKIMLKQMMDATEVGYYSTAITVNSIWGFVLVAIIDSVAPTIIRCVKTSTELFERKNRQLYATIIYASIFMGIVFSLFGERIIVILYTEAYLGAAAPLKILCWHTGFFYLVSARNTWFIAKDYHKYLKYIYGGAAIANVGLNFVLIPVLGASGAALASLMTHALSVIVIPYFIKDTRPTIKLVFDALLLRGIK
ncbi:MAG: flippase [Bacteroidales bacterium]|nr:flippase [Lachnoclostridium sp.]MCM1384720.1 flippase [Lachnoclostridium sp.]MCM1465266.1 flippase [Bacteroidales bacterium]